jgi:hypothetical protein
MLDEDQQLQDYLFEPWRYVVLPEMQASLLANYALRPRRQTPCASIAGHRQVPRLQDHYREFHLKAPSCQRRRL